MKSSVKFKQQIALRNASITSEISQFFINSESYLLAPKFGKKNHVDWRGIDIEAHSDIVGGGGQHHHRLENPMELRRSLSLCDDVVN
jgi:hypothetical protein